MVSFTLNGRQVSVDAAANTPLLWVIRDHVGLTGTKYGCGAGLCGACTVHLDGKAVRSCQTQVSDVTNKTVVTIEGLSPNASHPLQKAWVALEVPQCGYCQSGQIMKAANCSPRRPSRTARRSSRTWTATSAAAAPTTASSPPSNKRRGRAEP
jgi:isoquinoline 1-oxidoreductase alpha subunit